MQLDAIEDFLKTNEFEFEYKGLMYRSKKPTYKQKQEAYQKRIEKYTSLLKEKNEEGSFKYSIEEDLLRDYKLRGIDIEEMNKTLDKLVLDKNRLMMKLGEDLTKKAPKNELDLLRKEIEKINSKIKKIDFKKTQLLEF